MITIKNLKANIDDKEILKGINLTINPGDLAIAEAIIVMAHKLGLNVVGEGIETEAQRERLAAAGCNYGQGFLFSTPIPEHDFFEFLAGQGAHASP